MLLEEFEPVDEFTQGAGSEQKAKIQKSATSLFVLTWENSNTAPPINARKDMGNTVAKQVLPIHARTHSRKNTFYQQVLPIRQHHTCMLHVYIHIIHVCVCVCVCLCVFVCACV